MVMWPFGCSGCKAKDSEVAFLRGMLASSRSIIREPRAVDLPIVAAIDQGLAKPAQQESEFVPFSPAFTRNPIQDIDLTPDADGADND